jgi:hypothetical protein
MPPERAARLSYVPQILSQIAEGGGLPVAA